MSSSSTSNTSSMIQSAKYSGHQGPVVSLDISHDDHLLASGSEDGTARLWDVRQAHKRRACLCIPTTEEVVSVSFAPPSPTNPSSLNVAETNLFAQDYTL